MSFSTNCTNKGCGKFQEPYIDPKTDKVFCSICHKELINITRFVKLQMKSTKQYRAKETASFSVLCNKCNQKKRPKLVNNEIICGGCGEILDNISDAFKTMLKIELKTAATDISE